MFNGTDNSDKKGSEKQEVVENSTAKISEENNEEDSKIGLTKDNFISIPVSVSVIQYLGEPVVEYQNE